MLLAKHYQLWERLCPPPWPLLQGLPHSAGSRSDVRDDGLSPPTGLRSPEESTHPSLCFCCSQTHAYLLS